MRRSAHVALVLLALTVGAHRVAGAEGAPSVHGFADIAFKNAYVTPRGLVVTTRGLTVQPLVGLRLVLISDKGALDELSFVTGVWNDLCSCQHAESVGAWNELDYFGGLSFRLIHKLELGLHYLLLTSPPHFFAPEHNLELRAAFDDSSYLRGFGFHPYFKLFYAVAGDSTVVFGRKGNTFDVELGLIPSYKLRLRGESIALSLPTFLTIGGPGFFGDGGIVGVFSLGPAVAVPLVLVPRRLGAWQLTSALTWYHLVDHALVAASALLGNGGRRDELVATLDLGMSF